MTLPPDFQDAGITLHPLDVRTAGDAALTALAEHEQSMERERTPEDPPTPVDERIAGWRNSPDFAEIACWVARDAGGEIIANVWVEIWHTGSNEHAVWFNIQVLPDYRRRGLGRALLAQAVRYTSAKGRTLLITETTDRVPAGEALMHRLDAKPGLPSKLRQLELETVDRELMHRWLTLGERNADRYEMGFWEGPYPDADLDGILALHNITWNTEPRGDLALEDECLTADHIRGIERENAARGVIRWTGYLRERETGVFVGDTEVFWNANYPEQVWQGFTGVLPDHQGRGLGRWLKADMMLRIMRDRPEARHVRVGNADTNAPMLKINEEMGFRLFSSHITWQVTLEQVEAYLGWRTP